MVELSIALSNCHKMTKENLNTDTFPFTNYSYPSSILEPSLDEIYSISAASREIIRIIYSTRLLNNLKKISKRWSPSCLIHGDMRFENIIVKFPVTITNLIFKFVDWEFVKIGGLAWDDVGIFNSLILEMVNVLLTKNKKKNGIVTTKTLRNSKFV